eukprot:45165-Alexandrium_andersonii.AAC.1
MPNPLQMCPVANSRTTSAAEGIEYMLACGVGFLWNGSGLSARGYASGISGALGAEPLPCA